MSCLQFSTIRRIINDDDFWERLDVVVRVMEPAVKLLRYSDGMKGGSLGLLYSLLLQLDALYKSPIEGLPEDVRKKVVLTNHFWCLPPFFVCVQKKHACVINH